VRGNKDSDLLAVFPNTGRVRFTSIIYSPSACRDAKLRRRRQQPGAGRAVDQRFAVYPTSRNFASGFTRVCCMLLAYQVQFPELRTLMESANHAPPTTSRSFLLQKKLGRTTGYRVASSPSSTKTDLASSQCNPALGTRHVSLVGKGRRSPVEWVFASRQTSKFHSTTVGAPNLITGCAGRDMMLPSHRNRISSEGLGYSCFLPTVYQAHATPPCCPVVHYSDQDQTTAATTRRHFLRTLDHLGRQVCALVCRASSTAVRTRIPYPAPSRFRFLSYSFPVLSSLTLISWGRAAVPLVSPTIIRSKQSAP
jgi:hypothetical protein